MKHDCLKIKVNSNHFLILNISEVKTIYYDVNIGFTHNHSICNPFVGVGKCAKTNQPGNEIIVK